MIDAKIRRDERRMSGRISRTADGDDPRYLKTYAFVLAAIDVCWFPVLPSMQLVDVKPENVICDSMILKTLYALGFPFVRSI